MPLEHSLISSSFHCLADETVVKMLFVFVFIIQLLKKSFIDLLSHIISIIQKAIQLRQSNSNDIIEDKTFVSIVGCMR